MKKLIYLIFCCLIPFAGTAQTITPASTAQECVKVIHNAIKLGDGKDPVHPFTRTSSFTGGDFITYSTYTSSIYADVYQNINWADFDGVGTSKSENNRIFVSLRFKPNSLTREDLQIDVGRQLIKERESGQKSYIGFYLPVSEEGRINNIELAANRLKELAVQQSNIFDTYKTPSKIQTIEGKPSFYETVKYINTYLQDSAPSDLFCNTDSYKYRLAIAGEKLRISDLNNILQDINGYTYVELYSTYQRVTGFSNLQNWTYSINLSKVEEIRIVTATGFQGGCRQFGLWFIEKGKAATPQMHIPLWLAANEKNSAEFKDTQIYKAFEHLRKMSGAPEPLSF